MAVACSGVGIGGFLVSNSRRRCPSVTGAMASYSVSVRRASFCKGAEKDVTNAEEEGRPRFATPSGCSSPRRLVCLASGNSSGLATSATFIDSEVDGEKEPKPIVLIDQDSDPEVTIVEISFGDRLGALLDTIKALKDLGLNVVRGVVTTEGTKMWRKKFLVTRQDNNKKVETPELLEAIRLTIINNLLQYHPESSEQLALGEAFGIKGPPLKLDVDVATHITVKRDGPRSLLTVETADRPGLLLEIMKVIADISIYVESAEIDTEGLVAKDKFYVTYHGDFLSPSMEEVLTNSLRYYIRRPDTEEDSY